MTNFTVGHFCLLIGIVCLIVSYVMLNKSKKICESVKEAADAYLEQGRENAAKYLKAEADFTAVRFERFMFIHSMIVAYPCRLYTFAAEEGGMDEYEIIFDSQNGPFSFRLNVGEVLGLSKVPPSALPCPPINDDEKFLRMIGLFSGVYLNDVADISGAFMGKTFAVQQPHSDSFGTLPGSDGAPWNRDR